MPGDWDKVLLDNATYSRMQTGGIAIHLATLPRLILTALGAVIFGVTGAVLLPLWLSPLAAILGAAVCYVWAGRPSTLFDCDLRVMVQHSRKIPLAELERFHTIERRDEERHLDSLHQLLAGSRIVTRYEVYTCLRGEVVVVAYCRSKAQATELAGQINALLPIHT